MAVLKTVSDYLAKQECTPTQSQLVPLYCKRG
jgi:hypothetical protein